MNIHDPKYMQIVNLRERANECAKIASNYSRMGDMGKAASYWNERDNAKQQMQTLREFK